MSSERSKSNRQRKRSAATEDVSGITLREVRPGYWLADFQRDGKRVRKGFNALANARTWAQAKATEIRNHGTAVLSFTESNRLDATRALSLLGGRASLEQAAALWARQNPNRVAEKFSFTCWRYLRQLYRERARPITKRNARFMLRLACKSLGNQTTGTILAADVEAWIQNRGYSGNSAKGYRRIINAALNFYHGRRAHREQPNEKPPAIFDSATVKRIMRAAEQHDPGLIPSLAVLFFAGLRPYEALRLRWDNIHLADAEIVIPAEISKVRSARVVKISPPLDQWLARHRGQGQVSPRLTDFRRRRQAVLKRVGINEWPVDVARHTFASCLFAATGDASHVAGQLGHFGSPALFARHYKALVRKSDASGFFRIVPRTKRPEEQDGHREPARESTHVSSRPFGSDADLPS